MESAGLLVLLLFVFAFLVYFFKRPNKPDLKLIDEQESKLKKQADELKARMEVDYNHLERVKESQKNLTDEDIRKFRKDN